jgi:hypothetical protein
VNEAERQRIARRIEKAERRIASGRDQRRESKGTVSERAILARLTAILEATSR